MSVDLGAGVRWHGQPTGKVRRVRTVRRDENGEIVGVDDDNQRIRVVERDENGDISRVIEYERGETDEVTA